MKKKIYAAFIMTACCRLLLLTNQVAAQSTHQVLTATNSVIKDAALLEIPAGYKNNLHWDLMLDSVGKNGSSISWTSSNPLYISNTGKLLKRSPGSGRQIRVIMTATLSSGKVNRRKSFTVKIARAQQSFDGYLFVYFEGSGEPRLQEQLRFGASADAANWFALNENRPVLASDTIAATGGIRDPHILRGEDEKSFYIVATDMNTVKDGWGHNPGIVMLRSGDLVNWHHSVVDLEKEYPGQFRHVRWVWAPQTIYDPAAGKYLAYFTVCLQDHPSLDFYSAYANADFSGFEQAPTLMFSAKYGAIDGDIIYKDGTYHFFFKGNTKDDAGKEIKNGIRQATGKTLQGPWTEDFQYLDAYSAKGVVVEGSSVFPLNNTNHYTLMYDLYTQLRYEFQRSDDLYHFSTEPESFTKNFNPRHGSVIGITREEAKRLNQKWGGVPEKLLADPSGK